MDDLKERAVFDQYMKAYEEAISETSKEHAPWFVVPCLTKNGLRRVAAIQIIIETLEKMNLQYPTLSEEEIERDWRMRKSSWKARIRGKDKDKDNR